MSKIICPNFRQIKTFGSERAPQLLHTTDFRPFNIRASVRRKVHGRRAAFAG